eukprot:SAG25_NODE_318_length_9953_cov_9.168561_9_plen_756_part_00
MSKRESAVFDQIQDFLKQGFLDQTDVGREEQLDGKRRRQQRKSVGDWLGHLAVNQEQARAALERVDSGSISPTLSPDRSPNDNDTAVVSLPNTQGSPGSSEERFEMTETLSYKETCVAMCRPWSTEKQMELYAEAVGNGNVSLCLFPHDGTLRPALASFVFSSGFRNFILVLIIASSLMLAIEPSVRDKNIVDQLLILDWIFNAIFLVEALVKIVTLGFIGHKGAYLRSAPNILDFFLVVSSFVFAGMKSLRSIRILRPLRAVFRSAGMKLVVSTLASSAAEVSNVGKLLAIVWTVFGILGVALFGGRFDRCSDPDALAGGIAGAFVPSTGCVGSFIEAAPDGGAGIEIRKWGTAYYNFDHFGQAVITLFVVSTREGWLNIMWNGMDVTEIGYEPIVGHQHANALFFVSFIVVGYYFCLNILLGVIFDHFSKVKAEQGGGPIFQTKQQREWSDATTFILRMKLPYTMPRPPQTAGCIRVYCFRLATSDYCDYFIIVCILANVGLMMTQSYGQHSSWTIFLNTAELVFTGIFTLEAAIKIKGLGFDNYTKEPWNMMDLTIVITSLVDVGVTVTDQLANGSFLSGTSGGGSLLSLLRFLRVFRLTRLIHMFKAARGVQQLLLTLYKSLPGMKNVFMLLMLMYYTFAVLGMSLFAGAPHGGELDHLSNFDSFGPAMLTLCRISTGEGWPDLLQMVVVGLSDRPSDGDSNFSVRVTGPAFFITFIILSDFFFFNLLATVVIDQYDEVRHFSPSIVHFEL